MYTKLLPLSLIAAMVLQSAYAESITELDPLVVSSDFREKKLSETSNAVTVIGEEQLYDKASQAFIDVLGTAPNVNFSAGASKAKYIQIRGIGESSQFETPINPSVGLMIDGIDLSYTTLGATLFDVKQIEVLRGPQGTLFGANGLAGVVNVESNAPTRTTEGHIEATIGNYNTKAFGAAVGGEISEKLLGRFSVYKNMSDGFMKNGYLDRKDTNNIDELVAKAQLRWFASENHTIDLNLMHADIDNGYDAFALDNSRTTHSDEPGRDVQKTDALSLKSTYNLDPMRLISKLSYMQSDLLYSYDEDWSYVGEFDASLWPYMGFDQYKRDIEQGDIDIRALSTESSRLFNGTTEWTLGIYAKQFKEQMYRYHPTDYDAERHFDSHYKTKNKAVYTQLDSHLNDKLTLISGLRVEKWEADYSDSHEVVIKNDETMVGGKIGLNYQHNDTLLYYTTLSKGYKPGGVNAGTTLREEEKTFGTETLWNLEAGVNSSHLNNTLTSRLNLFYGKRKDMQVKLYQEEERSFTDYLSNASKGTYYGVESQLDYMPIQTLHLYASLGLLRAEFDKYTPELEGRVPAQSPRYQYNIGFNYFLAENWKFSTNLEGKGSYYFSNTHHQKSDAYQLLNTSLEYLHGNWSALLWVRNITNEDYQVRGFYFANNPANEYIDELYIQQGNPRTFGLTVRYDF